jgi:hypothetical protein
MNVPVVRSLVGGALASIVLLGLAAPAWAVPSYARQTGMACSTCHTVFPELTPFGREFKLNGYVLDNMKQIRGITIERQETLSLNSIPPISAMLQVSYTHTQMAVPDSVAANAANGALARDGDLLFPQQASLFYAGKIADGLGAFLQLTYDGAADHFGFDNTDVRFAHHLALSGASDNDLILGLTLNNNPTVQDAWNSTPAWGFPFAGSNVAPTPAAATQIDGTIGQNAGGLGGYLWWNHSIYAELSAYTASKVGGSHPLDSSQGPALHGLNPYWRLGWETRWDQNALFLGTYGIEAHIQPGGVAGTLGGETDKYTDYAVDGQYQYITDDHILTVLGTYIHEKQRLDASSQFGLSQNVDDTLNTMKLAANYYYRREIGGAVGFFNTIGTADNLLYPAGVPVTGSSSGAPNSRGFIFEVNYLPFLNVKLQLQYVKYLKFNGATTDYDGVGRRAADNNTVYLLGWFNF